MEEAQRLVDEMPPPDDVDDLTTWQRRREIAVLADTNRVDEAWRRLVSIPEWETDHRAQHLKNRLILAGGKCARCGRQRVRGSMYCEHHA
jgi:hypothetical protein